MKNDPIEQYRQLRQALIEERDRLRARLAEIEAALADAPAPARSAKAAKSALPRGPKAKQTRGGNAQSLKEAVIQVLSEKPMAKNEILEAVQAAGYKFTSKNPMNSLGVVLYGRAPKFNNVKGVFSVARGSKTAKPKRATASSKPKVAAKKKRTLSAEARARIVAAQKKRWAKKRAAKKK